MRIVIPFLPTTGQRYSVAVYVVFSLSSMSATVSAARSVSLPPSQQTPPSLRSDFCRALWWGHTGSER